MKFALFLIISCALLIHVAEAVPGDEKLRITKTCTEVHVETNHSASRKTTSKQQIVNVR